MRFQSRQFISRKCVFVDCGFRCRVPVNEPQHNKTHKMKCVQWSRRSACASVVLYEPLLGTQCIWLFGYPRAQSCFLWTAKTDQTKRICRLIWVFAGYTCSNIQYRWGLCLIACTHVSLPDFMTFCLFCTYIWPIILFLQQGEAAPESMKFKCANHLRDVKAFFHVSALVDIGRYWLISVMILSIGQTVKTQITLFAIPSSLLSCITKWTSSWENLSSVLATR